MEPPSVDVELAPIVRVVPWKDETGDGEFDPRRRYVERFWLSVLGPSATRGRQ